MAETCREMYLNEYINQFVDDEVAKRRMLDLYERKEKELTEYHKFLSNCHERINELEKIILELATIIGRDKDFIRKEIVMK